MEFVADVFWGRALLPQLGCVIKLMKSVEIIANWRAESLLLSKRSEAPSDLVTQSCFLCVLWMWRSPWKSLTHCRKWHFLLGAACDTRLRFFKSTKVLENQWPLIIRSISLTGLLENTWKAWVFSRWLCGPGCFGWQSWYWHLNWRCKTVASEQKYLAESQNTSVK